MLKNKIKETYNNKKYLNDYKKKSNPDYWKENDISQELDIEDVIVGKDNRGHYRSIYYNIDDIYSGMAIFKALTNKSILDALDDNMMNAYGERALHGFTINISLYKNDDKYDIVRDANINIILLDNCYGGTDAFNQDIENEYLKEKLISITKEIIQ